ncbi:MAG: MipA/OmpV family protein [Comamonadaceae bacterium]|nr:MipA/OmpV family protein [Comamonadaceae bacterium]
MLSLRSLCLGLALASVSAAALAEKTEPLWEVGAGVAAFSFPAYRGSDETRQFVLPVPYFVYRGEFLKADRDGLRARLFSSDRVNLTVSAALSPPATSDDIVARAGMPDLRASFEAGPQLDVTLWRDESRERSLKLLLPLRTAYTLERSPQHIGWVFHPKLNLDMGDMPGMRGWNVGMQAGPLFGDRRQHAYYYSVDPAFATVERPAYSAGGGYAGMQYLLGVSRRYPSHWVGAFLRYDSLSGANFADSPLVRDRSYLAAGVAVTWIFGQSATRVSTAND